VRDERDHHGGDPRGDRVGALPHERGGADESPVEHCDGHDQQPQTRVRRITRSTANRRYFAIARAIDTGMNPNSTALTVPWTRLNATPPGPLIRSSVPGGSTNTGSRNARYSPNASITHLVCCRAVRSEYRR